MMRGCLQQWGGGLDCAADPTALCKGNGDVQLVFGAWSYLVHRPCLLPLEQSAEAAAGPPHCGSSSAMRLVTGDEAAPTAACHTAVPACAACCQQPAACSPVRFLTSQGATQQRSPRPRAPWPMARQVQVS